MSKRMVFTIIAALVLLGLSDKARAQSAPAAPPAASGNVTLQVQGPADEVPPPGKMFFKFKSIEESFDGKVVTGAPYSADAVTETTQVLADGNRIAQKTTARVYRDSQGRTRREQTLGAIGPWGAPDDLPPMTMIHDPVAGVGYVLDPRAKIAMKHPEGPAGETHQMRMSVLDRSGRPADLEVGPKAEEGNVFFYRKDAEAPKAEPSNGVSVSLGSETVEGIEAQGTRETETIAAGAIGNEQPIQIVDERWYSPELQTVVMTKHSDPRFGETVYKLTNVSRQEPALALFQVPADYTVKEGPVRIRLEKTPDK